MATTAVDGSSAFGKAIARELKVEIKIDTKEVEGAAMDALMDKFVDEAVRALEVFYDVCHGGSGRTAVRIGRNTLVEALKRLDLEEPPEMASEERGE